ncbi:MAG TPA: phosphoribosylformylglycinamidine cyclo-ligase [Methanomicrobiales archaeon]|nr:phosphoribosylformylglycinamidine cyclo-ligase [Methanomicrobiales archaeon]
MGRETYRAAGVDIDLVKDAIGALTGKVTFRRGGPYGMLGGVGHYAGLIDFGGHVLALTTDGVGTKMLVADALSDWRTVGIDCIAMNANDLFVMNVEPVAFVDYIATDRLSVEKMAQIGEGLNEGARQANLNLVGGETAQLPGLVKGLDLAGTCLGVQEKEKVVTGEKIRPGDSIVGVPSSGVHSNGLSLARKVVEKAGGYGERLPGGIALGKALLTPTKIYHEALEACERTDVHGMCHVTGSGLLNFTRLTRFGFDFTDPLPVHPVFSYIQEKGEVDPTEMYRTFNMGMGFAYILPETGAQEIRKLIPGSKVVGTIVKEAGIRIKGLSIR